ncbi:MAG: hypothetical protein COY86_07375 [Rhodobacterales bacterium CG_4_10_14_0_8_um_filter_70_9]|nr:MAG: hypothetical protein COY86_07375 [Rhodobacterales bacterium CG_4_10_14_0_8_um_filter_70_9]PJA59873.1 MAG: hypothetical protein CO163_06935 [Rhodobacterales bacterium CG_4_9_14_3_um_filter_71_31]
MVARVRTAVEKAATLDAAFRNTPERFVHHPPEPPQAPIAVWITPLQEPRTSEPKVQMPVSQRR